MVNDYWKKRIEAEQKARIERDATLGQEMKRLYDYHFSELEKEIRAFEQRYADKNNIPLSEVKARVSDMDVLAFEEKAKRYVAEKDFSAKANAELALYNLKMKTSRLELLQYQMDLELLALSNGEHQLTEKFLNEEYIKELDVQAGLLGRSVLSASQIAQVAQTTINTPFKGAVWSDSIWQRQTALRQVVAQMTEDYLLKGKNPTTMISQLRKEFDVSVHQAKRLAVTEGARVATEAQKQAFLANGYDEYEFIAEPGACGICKPLDGKIFKVKDMEPGLNASPIHPFCRCSTAAHFSMSEEEYERLIRESAESVRERREIDVPELPVGIRWNAETGQFEKKGGAGVKTTAEVIKHLEEAKKRNGDRFNAKADRFLAWLKSYNLQDIPRIFQSKEKQIARIVEKVTNLDFTKASANDIIELGSQINKQFKVSEHLGDKEKLKEIFSHFREISGIVPKETWAKGTNRVVKAQLEEAFSYYPKDWALIPKEHGRQLLARKYDRGFFARGATTPSGLYYDTKYDNYESGFLTIVTDGVRKTTPYHEIGHMVEWANPDLVRIEKEWVARRTQGENYTRLKDIFPNLDYESDEITKKDDFVDPYIGKEYDNAAEVLTIGLQGMFVPEERFLKSWSRETGYVEKTILDDPEFLDLIIGLIVKG